MNELSPFVEEVIKNYSEKAYLQLDNQLQMQPGQTSESFGCSSNVEYVFKRLIGAILSTDQHIKFNAAISLKALCKRLAKIKVKQTVDYIVKQTNYKKHCNGKPSEIQAYMVGKFLIFNSLCDVLKDNKQVLMHLLELFPAFPQFQEHIIDSIIRIGNKKKSVFYLAKLTPTNKSSFLLHTVLLSKHKTTKTLIGQQTIDQIITEFNSQFPTKSIALSHIGPQLQHILASPASYLQDRLTKSLGDEEKGVNIRHLYYYLQLLGDHLKNIEINTDNVWKIISVKLLNCWLMQLKVQNKTIRHLAQSITIKFETNKILAFSILKKLHDQSFSLQNINSKHPLFQLFVQVQPEQYFNFLYELCTNQNIIQTEDQQAKPKSHFNQLQFFISVRNQELKIQDIDKALILFVNRYHQDKEESKLQALNTIFNSLISFNNKKHQKLQARPSAILAKLNFDQFQKIQGINELKSIAKTLRQNIKNIKQEGEEIHIAFANFSLALVYYLLIYPEQIQIFGELQMVQKDLKEKVLKEEGIKPSKKRKTNEQDAKKPIHVLVDIFISLLTKSPQFLRLSISHLFEQIIPFTDSSDLSHLLEVIEKPDAEYIQDLE